MKRTLRALAGTTSLSLLSAPVAAQDSASAFGRLRAAIETRDEAAIGALTQNDIMNMSGYQWLSAADFLHMVAGCSVEVVRAAQPPNFLGLLQLNCPYRRGRMPAGSCNSGDFSVTTQFLEGRTRMSIDESGLQTPACRFPPPAPPPPAGN